MPKRTTLILEDKVYERLVKESLSRYGSARKISKVVNEMVRKKTMDITKLIYSDKVARMSAREFEEFRRKLSARLEL
jgi:hypothetical protein